MYCIGLWGLALLLDMPNWIGWGGHTFGLKEMGCTYDRAKNHTYSIFLATTSIFIPFMIVLTSYLCIFLYVRHSRATLEKVSGRKHSIIKKSARNEDLQLAFTLFLTFLVFVVCWSPYMVGLLFDYKDEWPKELYAFGTFLGHSNSCLNSIIYAMCNKRFRQGYTLFFRKLPCLEIPKDNFFKAGRVFTLLKCTSDINNSTKINSSPIHLRSYQLA